MAKFTSEHKEELKNNYFEEGTHKVKISAAVLGETQDGKEYMEFTVVDDSGEKEDTARVWFNSDKAIQYSFNIIKAIFVHNAPEKKKQEIRDFVDNLEDTPALAKACQALLGKECWFQVSRDPNRTYVAGDGQTKPSINKNVYGYEPKPRTIQAAAPAAEGDLKMPEGSKDDQPFPDFS